MVLRPRDLLPRLVSEAGRQPRVELTRPEPHPAGALLGLGGMLAGVLAYRGEGPWRETLAAAGLGAVVACTAIAMVTAGIMSLAFMGFAGLDKYR